MVTKQILSSSGGNLQSGPVIFQGWALGSNFSPAATSELPQRLLFTAASTPTPILFHFVPTSVCTAPDTASEEASLASVHPICGTNSCFPCASAATQPTLLPFCCKVTEMVHVLTLDMFVFVWFLESFIIIAYLQQTPQLVVLSSVKFYGMAMK